MGGARSEKISVLIKGTRKLVLFPLLSCEGIARRQPSASQEESPHQNSTLPDLGLRLLAPRIVRT